MHQEERAPFLSAPPTSGELSPFAQKLAAVVFVWFCSLVVFFTSADLSRQTETCNAACAVVTAFGVVSFAFLSIMLLGHCLMWNNTIDRSSFLTSSAEMRIMMLFAIWWIACAALASSEVDISKPHATGVTIAFAWLCVFGSIFGSYKAYHATQEDSKSLHDQQARSFLATEEEEYANFS